MFKSTTTWLSICFFYFFNKGRAKQQQWYGGAFIKALTTVIPQPFSSKIIRHLFCLYHNLCSGQTR